MITGEHIAETAVNSGLLGTPYNKLDCQAFVEVVLKKAGMKIPNYRGSNHMWRDLVYDREPITNPAFMPAGCLVFIVKYDGGEVKRGYHDDMGNATHVGIYLGNNVVMDSSTGGVQYSKLTRFTDWALIKDVDYYKGSDTDEGETGTGPTGVANTLLQYVQILKDNLDGLEAAIYDIYGNS